jgi:predicted NBD/HSP70 family sugar kinase
LPRLGICSPGPVDPAAGLLIDPPNLQGLHNTPLRTLLETALELPVVLEHDANAAALGDFHFGAGRDAEDMSFIVVGTGVGAAIIVDGQLYRGRHGAAGEIGHVTLDRPANSAPAATGAVSRPSSAGHGWVAAMQHCASCLRRAWRSRSG